MASCTITRNQHDEIVSVKAANGNDSKLFADILAHEKVQGDKELAVQIYKSIYTEEFEKATRETIAKEKVTTAETKDANAEYKLDWLEKHALFFVPKSAELRHGVYQSQMEGKTKDAKDAAERLLLMNDAVTKPVNKNDKYIVEGKELNRVTEELKKDEFFGYRGIDEEETEEDILRQAWGNTVDKILNAVVAGEDVTLDKDDKITQEVFDYLKKYFSDLIAKYPGHIFLSQMSLFNVSKNIAGTADVVMINPEGELRFIDLKTSLYPFTEGYKTDAGFDAHYNKRVTHKEGDKKVVTASRKDRHSAQVGTYAAMAEAMGFKLAEKPILILPFQITKVDGDKIARVKHDTYGEDDFIEGEYFQTIQARYNKDTRLEGATHAITRALKILKEHAMLARQRGKPSGRIEAIIKEIDESVDAEAAIKFIDNAYTTFVANIAKQYNKEVDTLKKATPEQYGDAIVTFLNFLDDTRKMMDIYHGKDSILKSINKLYRNIKDIDPGYRPEAGSPLDKIETTIRVIDDLRTDIDDILPGIMARILAKQVHLGSIEAMKAKEQHLIKKVNASPKDSRNRVKHERELAEHREKFHISESGDPDMIAKIEQEIKQGGYKDIGAMDRWFSPAVSMDNSFLATFVLTLKEAFEKAKALARDFMYQAHEAFEEYAKVAGASRDNPNQFNAGLFKKRNMFLDKDTTKEVLSFVAPLDYGRFEAERTKMFKEAEKIKDRNAKNKFVADWYAANTQLRPLEHVEGVTTYNGVKLLDSVRDVAARMKKNWGEDLTNKYISEHVTFTNGKMTSADWTSGMLIPSISKYADSDFAALRTNAAKFKFYLFLMNSYLRSQSRLPARKSESHRFLVPFVKKSGGDRLREGKFWDAFKNRFWDEAMLRIDEDYQTEGLEDTKTIPILFYNDGHTMDAADVSTDLMASILKFEIASLRYEQQSRHSSLADNLLLSVKQTEPAATDSAGWRILSKAAKAVGITEGMEKYVKKHGSNQVAAMLEAFIDVTIYGQRRKDPTFKIGSRVVDLGKVADSIISFSSKTQIAADWTLALANSLQARVNQQIEAAARQYYNGRDWIKAEVEYDKHLGAMVGDRLNPVTKSLMGQLIDLYEPIQGTFTDEFGHRLSKSKFKARMNSSLLYFGMKSGEHHAQVKSMIAMMLSKQVMQNGKPIPLYEAYERDASGKLKLREGVEMTELVDRALQNRLHAVNKRLHGVYNSFDGVEIERHWYGRLLIMYKKWLAPGLKRRWKAEGFDYELGDFTEGMYSTFFKKLFGEFGEFAKYVTGKEHTFSPMEIANIRRTLYEFSVIAITGTLAIILSALGSGADTDKKWKYQWPLYFLMRLNAEISIYGGLGDPSSLFLPNLREVISPYRSIPVMTVLQKVTNLYSSASGDVINLMLGQDINRYQNNTGIFDAGTSKTWANAVKVWGISGKSMDSDLALDILLLQKGSNVAVVGKTRE